MLRSLDFQLFTDVSGRPFGIIFKGQAVPEEPLKMWSIRYPETSVTTNLRRVTPQKSEDFFYASAGDLKSQHSAQLNR